MPTPVGVTSEVLQKLTAGACVQPPPGFSRTLPTPETSLPAAFLSRPVSDETPKVPTPNNNIHPHSSEELLFPRYLPRFHNQYNIGRIRKVSPQCPPCLQVLEVLQDVTKSPPPPRPRVICIPRLSDTRCWHCIQ